LHVSLVFETAAVMATFRKGRGATAFGELVAVKRRRLKHSDLSEILRLPMRS
jgi:hypothetical protein